MSSGGRGPRRDGGGGGGGGGDGGSGGRSFVGDDPVFSAAAQRAFSLPVAGGESAAGQLEAGRSYLQHSFTRGVAAHEALDAATSARNAFAACWEVQRAAAPRDEELCARLAALTGEALIRMATLLIKGRRYELVLEILYEPGLVLLASARSDTDRRLAMGLASVSAGGAPASPSFEAEVSQAIDMSFAEAMHQRKVLQAHIQALETKLEALRASRDNVRASMGEERWKAGNKGSDKGQAIQILHAECTKARALLEGMLALDAQLSAITPASGAGRGRGGGGGAGPGAGWQTVGA